MRLEQSAVDSIQMGLEIPAFSGSENFVAVRTVGGGRRLGPLPFVTEEPKTCDHRGLPAAKVLLVASQTAVNRSRLTEIRFRTK
jgi:hypothetical protein